MKKGVPQCLGFIMDGNRRWAKENNLSTYDGHKKGSEVFIDSVRWIREVGVSHAVYYAFSTENWMRKEAEVVYLMDLFRDTFSRMETLLEENNQQSKTEKQIKIKIVGQREDFPIG
ncbi:MAG: undecaprenyl diphosphate synthase family protein, partial [Candidatus Pacebacteria bacterium]|nr:undecaprenyl diphosphate synthase family protein [Candidatus Paceibacterota bacterium]